MEDTLYDYDGVTSVSLAALGVLGDTMDDSMRVLYANADRILVPDTEETLEANRKALYYTPLRSDNKFQETRENGYIISRPSELSFEDIECALENKHGPGNFKWTRCKTKWWKDSRGKYIVTGEMNTSSVVPGMKDGKKVDVRVDWIDLGVHPDNAVNRHVIAVSGGRFYCKNIREWLPVKYLWIGKNGQPAKRRSKGKVLVDSLFTRIHAVYKVSV